MANPIVGLGSSFSFATVLSPTTFTVLNGVNSISTSGDKTSTEKTTNMLTPNGVDTYISGTTEPGTVDIKCFYLPADTTQVALAAIRAAGSVIPCEIVLPLSLGTRTFSGIVESMTVAYPLDKPATLDVKVKISGVISWV
jgi:hypothetical protein